MKRAAALLLALLMLLPLIACGTKDAWQEQYDLGIRCLRDDDYQKAIDAFTAAIGIDESRPKAYFARGHAYALSDETKENLAAARSDLEKALELAPTYADVWLELADVLIRQEDYDSAEEALRQGYEATESQKISEKMEQLAEIRKSEFYWASFVGKPLREVAEYLGEDYACEWASGYVAYFPCGRMVYCETSYENLEPSDDDLVSILVLKDDDPVLKELTVAMTYPELKEAVGDRTSFGEMYYDYSVESGENEYSLGFKLDGYFIEYIWRDDPYQAKATTVAVAALPDEIVLTQEEAEKLACDYFDYTPGDVSPENGYKLCLTYDGMEDRHRTKKHYYVFRLQWLVPPDFHPSTIGLVMVDAKTGECRDYY